MNKMLGIIREGIVNKAESIMIPLYKTMVHPHLEGCAQFLSPHLQKGERQRSVPVSEQGWGGLMPGGGKEWDADVPAG